MIDSIITIRVVGRSSSSEVAPQLTLRPAFLAIANRCYVQSDPTGPLLFFSHPEYHEAVNAVLPFSRMMGQILSLTWVGSLDGFENLQCVLSARNFYLGAAA